MVAQNENECEIFKRKTFYRWQWKKHEQSRWVLAESENLVIKLWESWTCLSQQLLYFEPVLHSCCTVCQDLLALYVLAVDWGFLKLILAGDASDILDTNNKRLIEFYTNVVVK